MENWSMFRERMRVQFGSIFGGRSSGWWVGVAVTFVGVVLVSAAFNIELRNMALFLVALGGAAGHWVFGRLGLMREAIADDRSKTMYRPMLVIGVVLFVVNILPDYREDFRGNGGGRGRACIAVRCAEP